MRVRLFNVCVCALVAFLLMGPQAVCQTMTLENPLPKREFSEDRPDFLHIKDVTLTKSGKNSYDVDMTLYGNIPRNLTEKYYYYFGFDIDNDKATGTVGNVPNYGEDIGLSIRKVKGTNRFEENSKVSVYRGRDETISVTGLKVADNKISFKMRSPLFGISDTFKFYVGGWRVQYSGDLVASEVRVDTLPRTSVATFKP